MCVWNFQLIHLAHSKMPKFNHRCPFILILLVLLITNTKGSNSCLKTKSKMSKNPNQNDVYTLEISGNPVNYVPGDSYNITLKPKGLRSKHRFGGFTISVEHESSNMLETIMAAPVGHFRLIDSTLTRFSSSCRNTVEETNFIPKAEVQVEWVTPPPKSGCIIIKATVVESDENWFDSTGDLVKTLCEEEVINADIQPQILTHCCACDEAKYEIAFQGLWSRNTHPKNFPSDVWSTKFSDIIGSSHQLGHSFWSYGGFASPGLKELAEEGKTEVLEKELKADSKHIRTIIKARELAHPHVTDVSYTLFRVDKENHLLSLVSKISPSPDWIVGVSNLELCLRNCTWVDSRVLNLYPWDVGTDDGITYMSPDAPSQPEQAIRRIRSNSPNNPESPFYSENGEPLKPLAKLQITREKLYAKTCSEEATTENCTTTEWSGWSSCSDDCMKFRTREYIESDAAEYCRENLEEKKACKSHLCKKKLQLKEDDPRCEVGDWSEWSSCSASCGKGVRTKDRTFKNPEFAGVCAGSNTEELQKTEGCKERDCEEGEENPETGEEDCPDLSWGDWSPCSVTCGDGIKERLLYNTEDKGNDDEEENEEDKCSKLQHKQTVICYNSPCEEEATEEPTESPSIGLPSDSQVLTSVPWSVTYGTDGLPVIDCKVSRWSVWSRCNVTESCQKGYKYRQRFIEVHPQNGGNPCPKKLLKKKRCKSPCNTKSIPADNNGSDESEATLPSWGPSTTIEARELVRVDCVMGPWSAWSPCSNDCGSSAVQIRTRSIKVHPNKNGRPCGVRMEERPCRLPLACTQ